MHEGSDDKIRINMTPEQYEQYLHEKATQQAPQHQPMPFVEVFGIGFGITLGIGVGGMYLLGMRLGDPNFMNYLLWLFGIAIVVGIIVAFYKIVKRE